MPETQMTNPPSFESVWALVKEVTESQKETARRQEEDREHLKETERIMKEDSRRLKEELNIKIGALTNLFGDFTEAMLAPKICEKFKMK